MNTVIILLLPVILLAGAFLVIMLDAFQKNASRSSFAVSVVCLLAALISSAWLWQVRGSVFGGMFVLDSFSLTTSTLFIFAGLVAILLVRQTPEETPQFHALILLTLVGMILFLSGTHFLVIFIGLETLSLSIYVLATFAKKDPKSAESGIKYFLLGSFASAFFLYGMAFIYGATGSLQINAIGAAIQKAGFSGQAILYMGIIFLLVGYGFKISVAPFHMWTPDVYEGAPTPVTAFMAATVKSAALASLMRVFLTSFYSVSPFWVPVIAVLAVLTMFAGNLTALWQDHLKRLLAYSSVAHAGYMLLALLVEPAQAQQSLVYYFAAYVFMNLGAFAVVSYLESHQNILEIREYRGLAYTRPALAACMTLFLLSLGGLPPTAGFFGKFYLFRAVLQAGHVWIVVLAVINSAISFYYYLRVVISMFTPEEQPLPVSARVSISIAVILAITVWGTITLGLFPNFFLNLVRSVAILS
jgi:NADH-quinone oxidoreductase subunit N